MRARVLLLAISFVLPLVMPTTAAASPATGQPRRWVHHADLEGDGTPDRVVITADKDLRIDEAVGTGHYTVRVRLSSTHKTLTRRLDTDGYNSLPAKHWTPWFGATDIDHAGGQEIVLGEQSGASSSEFHVLVYTHGRLRALPAPGGQPWEVNSDAAQSNGYRCTPTGIEARGYGPAGTAKSGVDRWIIDRDFYVWRDDAWHLTKRLDRMVRSTGEPPGTQNFGTFRCAGLPSRQL